MTETTMNNGPPRGLLWSAARLVLKGLFYCWFGRALYLFVYDDFVASHGLLARVYLAARDSFFDLPETLGFLVDLVLYGLNWLHQSLVGDLGYDPIAWPDLSLPEIDAGLTWPGADLPALQSLAEQALQVGLALVAGQFALFFLILACGGCIGWTAPGLPVVLNARARLFYWGAYPAVIAALAYGSLQGGLVAAGMAVVLGLLCLRFPIFAGLPLWLLEKIFGLHPRRVFSWLRRLLVSSARLREARHGRGGARRQRPGGEGRDGGARRRQGRDHGLPEAQDAKARYEAACATFELKPGGFARGDLRQRYRALMKKVHPDRQGSARLATLINADYELVLTHHGWQR